MRDKGLFLVIKSSLTESLFLTFCLLSFIILLGNYDLCSGDKQRRNGKRLQGAVVVILSARINLFHTQNKRKSERRVL